MRLRPRNLVGQVALLLGIALLVAQLVNFALILNERQKVNLAQDQGPAITRFQSVEADVQQATPASRTELVERYSRRGARYSLDPASAVGVGDVRQSAIEQRVRDGLGTTGEVRASFGSETRRSRDDGKPNNIRVLQVSARLPDGTWLNARLPTPPADPWLVFRLGAATLLLYLIVLGASLWIARRLVRPLGDLAAAADRFAGHGTPDPVESRGPADLRRAIDAFNAMNQRVVGLLAEKDVMLGAIGHDLRTPLASLRIRAESVKPAAERDRMIATIGQMAAMLEDILVLARTGHSQEALKTVDLSALVDALVEEYREAGQPVTLVPSARVVAAVKPNLLSRAIRNLIENGVRYGGAAVVSVTNDPNLATIKVSDAGPGLAPETIEEVSKAFVVGDASRHRSIGGSGLGLAIARAVADSHGGTLRLENGRSGGLIATVEIPAT